MKIAVVAGLFAKGNMNINAGHEIQRYKSSLRENFL
jgi:hypothetical protein